MLKERSELLLGSLSFKITINTKQQIHDTALLFMLGIVIIIFIIINKSL